LGNERKLPFDSMVTKMGSQRGRDQNHKRGVATTGGKGDEQKQKRAPKGDHTEK